jgi:hypothetical protein
MDTKETQKTNQTAGGEKKNGLCRFVTRKRARRTRRRHRDRAHRRCRRGTPGITRSMAAMRQQEHAALSQMNTIQAEKLGLSLLSEDQARSAAAEAIGQDVSAISFDEVSLLTAQQMRSRGEEKKEHKRGHKREEGPPRCEPQGGAPGRDGGPAMLRQRDPAGTAPAGTAGTAADGPAPAGPCARGAGAEGPAAA